MPKALEEEPEITDDIEPYLEAFLLLGNFRNENGKINFSDILSYAKEIGESNSLEFASIIARGDSALKAAQAEKKEQLEKSK